MLRELDTTFLSDFKHKMESGYQELSNPIDIVLSTLVEIGFSSCRYWMLCVDEVEGASFFVLSKAIGQQNLKEKYGYTIPITECSVFDKLPENIQSITEGNVSVFEHTRSYIASNPKTAQINDDLRLNDDFYIHFPILCHGDVHGQISCSYQGDFSLSNQDLINGLNIIGMMLGDYKLLYSQKKLETAKAKFASEESSLIHQKNNSTVLAKISALIIDLVDAEFASAFDFNWYEGCLVKVAEASESDGDLSQEMFPESHQINRYLTGLAYNNHRYRYVFDVSRLLEREPDVMKDDIVRYLKKKTNSSREVHGCIAFGLIGGREHKSLIRIFNKAGDARIPFDLFDLDALKAACEYFSKAYDDIISYSQLDRLQNFSDQITENFFEMDTVCKIAHQYLTDEWVSEIIVFGSLDTENFATIYKKGSSSNNNYVKLEQKLSPFLKQCLVAKDINWVETPYSFSSRNKPLETYLRDSGFRGLLVVPNDFGNFTGGMGVPLRHRPKLQNREATTLHAANIRAYSSILCKLMSFMRNLLALGHARDFVGTIGHELKKPIADISRERLELEKAVKDLVNSLPGVSSHEYWQEDYEQQKLVVNKIPFVSFFNQSLNRMGELIRTTDVLVDVASTVAQISNNTIELTYQPVNIFKLAQNIARDIKREVDLLQGARNLNVIFTFNRSFNNLKPLICDEYIVAKIIENIFRNALKYSTPPGRNNPIKIEVVANPQPGQYLNIQVKNWGMPVPEGRQEEIFQPFIRGSIRDEIRAKRGMGIGLYIARLFAEAHEGTVSMVSSDPGFSDHRRKDKEGWNTIFEIRLSDKLSVGTYQFDIEQQKLEKP